MSGASAQVEFAFSHLRKQLLMASQANQPLLLSEAVFFYSDGGTSFVTSAKTVGLLLADRFRLSAKLARFWHFGKIFSSLSRPIPKPIYKVVYQL